METDIYDKKVEVPFETMKVINETRKWTLFISIIGFIGIGFIVLIGLLFGSLTPFLSGHGLSQGLPTVLIAFIYLVIAVVYFFPVYFLYKFSVFAKRAFHSLESGDLHLAIKNLRTHYQIIGVLLIVFIGLYVIIGVGALLLVIFTKF